MAMADTSVVVLSSDDETAANIPPPDSMSSQIQTTDSLPGAGAPTQETHPSKASSLVKCEPPSDLVSVTKNKVYSLCGQSNGTEVKIVVPEKKKTASYQSRVRPKSSMKRSLVQSMEPEIICLDDDDTNQGSEDLAGHPLLVARPPQKIRKLTPTGSVSSDIQSSIPPAKIVPCNQSKTVKTEIDLPPIHQIALGNVSIHPIVVLDGDDEEPMPKSEDDLKPPAPFDPVENAIEACRLVLPTDEFTSVVKKFKKRIKNIPPGLLENEKFAKFVQERETKIRSDSKNIYIHIKELLDELKRVGCSGSKTDTKRRIIPESIPNGKEQSQVTTTVPGDDEPVPSTSASISVDTVPEKSLTKTKEVSSSHLLKLTEAQKKLHKAITRLEESECDLEADEDSNYLKLSRFKARFLKINRKIAECLKLNPTLERRQDKRFKCQGSRILEVNVKIEKWVNRAKKANREFFPDFADIVKLIESVNQEKNLCLSKSQILDEAKESFIAVGRTLKAQRVHDDMEDLDSYLSEDILPMTDEPEDLKRQLDENLQLGKDNLNRVFDDFVRKEVDSGEKPEEVQDEDVDNESSNEINNSGQEDMEHEVSSEATTENPTVLEEPTSKADLSAPLEKTSFEDTNPIKSN
ncbi:uncharacterized protein LOC131886775 isoform X2 [Tigriopus californicus]|uniref:uncharacterized protein LOC131886775 isoform X2 n=1 Tax=Tigriopus californicus TaxID=6832 RepID=UPI0027DA814A|nr:uncharacterized protein LOC131886775 isoform X2 [Tigriopus californicus]